MFKLYIVLTLFVGVSILQFFNIKIEDNGILSILRFYSIPFLIITYILNYNKNHLYKHETTIITFAIFMLFFVKFVMGRSAGLAQFFNNVLEPILLVSLLRCSRDKYYSFIKKSLLVFFIIECGLAYFEYLTHNVYFAKRDDLIMHLMEYSLAGGEFRSYSLHGHPLQNAFIVSILSVLFLCSNYKLTIRYPLFLIGYFSLYTFNTRSSIYLLGIIFIYMLFKDFFSKNTSAIQKNIIIAFSICSVILLQILILKYNFGSRLIYSINATDSSSNARFLLVKIISSMDISDIILGIGDEGVRRILIKHDLFAIENSIINYVLSYGFIYTIIWLYATFMVLKQITNNKLLYTTSFFVFFILMNANNALVASTPITIIYILGLYSISDKDHIFYNDYMYKCNIRLTNK